jgi:hypothetical protein
MALAQKLILLAVMDFTYLYKKHVNLVLSIAMLVKIQTFAQLVLLDFIWKL